ncbi:MAG: ATP-binding protein [candidate division WOR-3 bacterium]|nr:ATP-binding protein [candidate division WOR-3 bacterium]
MNTICYTMNGKMAKITIYVISFFYLLTFSYADNYQWTLKSLYKAECSYVIPSDYEGDGIDEILECYSYYVMVRDQYGIDSKQYTARPDQRVMPLGFFRLNDTIQPSLFISVVDNDTVKIISAYDDKKCIAFVGKDISKAGYEGYDGNITQAFSSDINNDGFNEIICIAVAAFDLYPRGIFVFDYKNSKELWHYWLGGAIIWYDDNLYCADINGDDKKEIFFGTIRTSNGAVMNDIDDMHAWVIALNSEGQLMWKKQLCRDVQCAIIYVGDIYRNNKWKVIVCENERFPESEYVNQIMILNAENGEIEHYLQTGEAFLGMAVCDLNRDGRVEIITGNTDATLRILNDSLKIIKEKTFDNPITVLHATDLDANGTKEILLSTKDHRLIILDEDLKTLVDSKDFPERIMSCYLLKNERKFNLLTSSYFSSNHEIRFAIYQVSKRIRLTNFPILLTIHIAIISGLTIGLFVSLSAGIKYRKRIRRLVNESPYGIIILNKKGKITFFNHHTRKLIGEDENKIYEFLGSKEIRELIISNDKSTIMDFNYDEKKFQVRFFPIGGERLIIITDRTEEKYIKEIFSWAGLAQRLAHEIKNPLSTINLTLQRMCQVCYEKFGKKAEVIDNYSKSILEEVERLRKATDRFMRILSIEKPAFVHIDINNLINEITSRYENTLPDEIQIKKFLTPGLPLIKCDENQISTVITNLIENAIESMDGNGVLNIRTNMIEKIDDKDRQIKKFVEIIIEDTGKGMSEEQLKNLFKPFYTTKKNGTGLGLVIAKRVIDIHRGTIEISSKEGIGTIVTVTLPNEY